MSRPAIPSSTWFQAACRLLGLLGLLGLTACTNVTVYAGDGSIAVHRNFGFVSLQPTLGSTPIVFRGSALGLQSGPWGYSLGYSQTSLTLLPPGCHFVVAADSEKAGTRAALKALRDAGPCELPTPPEGVP